MVRQEKKKYCQNDRFEIQKPRKEIGWEKQNGIIRPPSKINRNKQENVTN